MYQKPVGFTASVEALLRELRSFMGFDPTRQHSRSYLDYWLVALALLLIVGIVIWAVLG